MGHGNHRALIVLQVMLQPGYRFGIQMVCGFIQQQYIGLRQQQTGQGYPAAFPARKQSDRHVGRRAIERAHRQFEVAVQVPAIYPLQCFLQAGLFRNQLVKIGVRVRKGFIDLIILRQQIDNGLYALADNFDDCF